MIRTGFFITFEGVDGSGKGTQVEMLKNYFKEQNIDAIFTREPGGTKVSEKIREVILDNNNKELTDVAEMFLFSASRSVLVENLIKPALKQGKIVVCDRFVDSSISYQGYGRNLGADLVEKVNDIALNGCKPNLTFLLDLSGEIGEKRNKQFVEKQDRMETNSAMFKQKVRLGFLEIAQRNPKRFVILDASKSKEEIFGQILSELEKRKVLTLHKTKKKPENSHEL